MTFGRVHVGLWMKSPEEVEAMLKALEARLRQMDFGDPDRHLVEGWRKQAMGMRGKAARDEWPGWES